MPELRSAMRRYKKIHNESQAPLPGSVMDLFIFFNIIIYCFKKVKYKFQPSAFSHGEAKQTGRFTGVRLIGSRANPGEQVFGGRPGLPDSNGIALSVMRSP
ncbi:hypothetical protein EQM14_12310 [Caproiciproducens sp. NJN-50]|uniref:hypothetical protein n=1 Tax=Acutalibacteraceae TaxID=3082771 RepID=UPI000FFE139A|nr:MULTISPECIES: hypothetical protein [Acutalibacteraceae]QAT50482.1 hypothetical protein EQM14_12310 [Caproiciproducens sp. NJN-50]